MNMRKRNKLHLEALERRYCLTVGVSVDDGDLIVSGDADGAIEIKATAANTFEVSDNGVVVGTVEGVTDDVRIRIDASAEANDQVTLDLGGQTIDKLMVNLGGGDNTFTLQGGTVKGAFTYSGGSGDDAVT